MKSQIWLLDPRPEPGAIVDAVEHGFALSEASHTPVMLQLRIRACHVHGSFVCKDNRAPAVSMRAPIQVPHFDYGHINLPPSTYEHERQKVSQRWPAALAYLREHRLNEVVDGDLAEVGLILPGGLYNGVIRALQQLGLADPFGETRVGLLVLSVVYPLDPEQLAAFCRGRRAVLVVEEGQPNYLEDAIHAALRRAGVDTTLDGKGCFPTAGEYTGEVLLKGLAAFLVKAAPQDLPLGPLQAAAALIDAARNAALQALGAPVPNRPPGFCVGCPERPVFAAIKLLQQETGDLHVNADIGCHTFGTLPPFNIGNSVLGYGLGLASSSGIGPLMAGRTISLMGDGGFWHNGLTSGVINAVTNGQDSVLVILKNGYTSATGAQAIPSSPGRPVLDIAHTLSGVGVRWLRTVPSYQVADLLTTLREAMSTAEGGLKVIIADGECQLERQRRIKPEIAAQLQRGERVVRTRFGVDDDVCSGDHACMRLSGCPSLTLKPNPNPLRTDPVASVNAGCVGCGLCGENAQAATLCPSFFKAEVVQHAGPLERLLHRLRRGLIGRLAGAPRVGAEHPR